MFLSWHYRVMIATGHGALLDGKGLLNMLELVGFLMRLLAFNNRFAPGTLLFFSPFGNCPHSPKVNIRCYSYQHVRFGWIARIWLIIYDLNSIFLSHQTSQQYFQTWLISQSSRNEQAAYMEPSLEYWATWLLGSSHMSTPRVQMLGSTSIKPSWNITEGEDWC